MPNHSFVTETVLKIIGNLVESTEQGRSPTYSRNTIVTAIVLFGRIRGQQEREQQ